jgi:hypothetical protein
MKKTQYIVFSVAILFSTLYVQANESQIKRAFTVTSIALDAERAKHQDCVEEAEEEIVEEIYDINETEYDINETNETNTEGGATEE